MMVHHGEQLSLMYQGLLEFFLCASLQKLLAEGYVQEHGGECTRYLCCSLGAFLGVEERRIMSVGPAEQRVPLPYKDVPSI